MYNKQFEFEFEFEFSLSLSHSTPDHSPPYHFKPAAQVMIHEGKKQKQERDEKRKKEKGKLRTN